MCKAKERKSKRRMEKTLRKTTYKVNLRKIADQSRV